MKIVILRYKSDKSTREHKFKVTGTNLCSVLRQRISSELPQFKDKKYLLISRKYDNCMSFLKEDKPFNKLFHENRVNIDLILPPPEAEILLPNQSIVHLPIDLTKIVSENIKELISFIQKTDSSYSIYKNSDDFVFESLTFIFSPSRSDVDGSDDMGNNNENTLNAPQILSSTLPLLFQGWSGEKLTLIRRIVPNDLIIAEDIWKKREHQIQKMKDDFENKDKDNKSQKKTVKFAVSQEKNEEHIPLKEKSKSISIFELKNAKKNVIQDDED